MPISHVTWDVYTSLRDYPISHPDVRAALTARGPNAGEPEDGWRLGHATSWGRWGPGGNLTAPITATSPALFSDLAPLTTSVVLFAVNWGGRRVPAAPVTWQNFHTPGHTGDCFLGRSVEEAMDRTGLTAAPYMSDVFKLIPTPTAADLLKTIRDEELAGRDPVGRCAELLRHELCVCTEANGGVAPVVVGLGKAAFGWLSGSQSYHRKRPNPIAEVVGDLLRTDPAKSVLEAPHYTFGAGAGGELVTALSAAFRQALHR
ncbi:hypothetical protein [Corynebacterium variabile]|uniref:hypothetical protein n=1 Tax=Corynebacterium variabile TaxID=1727 RepID=UPI002FE1EA6F